MCGKAVADAHFALASRYTNDLYESMTCPDTVTLIKFECLHCKQSIEANSSLAGTEACCPTCKKGIRVPQLSEKETPTDPQMEPRIVILRKEKVLKAADIDFANAIAKARTKSDKLRSIQEVKLGVHRILEDCGSLDNSEVDDLAKKWRQHVEESMPSFGLSMAKKIRTLGKWAESNIGTIDSESESGTKKLLHPQDAFGQYILAAIGFIAIAMILFPPFYGNLSHYKTNLGYGFLFAPPGDDMEMRGKVDSILLAVQMLGLFGGGFLLFAGRAAVLNLVAILSRRWTS